MNMIEEAIIYATVLHQSTMRKIRNIPAVLHPLEVAQILETMTEDYEKSWKKLKDTGYIFSCF